MRYARHLNESNIDWKRDYRLVQYVYHGEEKDKQSHDEYVKSFEVSRLAGRNIMISFEEFGYMDKSGVLRLKKDLNNFDVRIVHLYQDPMSHLLSLYSQLNKGSGLKRNKTHSMFSQIFGRLWNEHLLKLVYHDTEVLQQYAEIFGRDKITVIDMAGSALTGHDIAYTVFCEVMGVLCDKPHLFKNSDFGRNGHEDIIMLHVNSLFTSYLSNINANALSANKKTPIRSNNNKNINTETDDGNKVCRYCTDDYAKAGRWFKQWYSQTLLARDAAKYRIPTTVANLTMLIPYMDGLDDLMQKKFGDLILHYDQPGILASIRRNSAVDTLDIETFFHQFPWLHMFSEALEAGKKVPELLCDC